MIISPFFYKKQYIGHARYQAPYPENSLLLYKYLFDELQYNIVEADIVFTLDGIPVLNHFPVTEAYIDDKIQTVDINKLTFAELSKFSRSSDGTPFCTAEDYIKLAAAAKKCVMLDLTFQKYSISNYRSLYRIVKKYGMEGNTIWGDPDILKLALIDRHLVCQFAGSWGRKMLLFTIIKSFFCKVTMMSFSYYGGEVENFANIVKAGHFMGFIMKVATVNDEKLANRFWRIGTDLIITDTLKNTKY